MIPLLPRDLGAKHNPYHRSGIGWSVSEMVTVLEVYLLLFVRHWSCCPQRTCLQPLGKLGNGGRSAWCSGPGSWYSGCPSDLSVLVVMQSGPAEPDLIFYPGRVNNYSCDVSKGSYPHLCVVRASRTFLCAAFCKATFCRAH